jgi:hypothetical protein
MRAIGVQACPRALPKRTFRGRSPSVAGVAGFAAVLGL